MGSQELKNIEKLFGWFRSQASWAARGCKATDTQEVCSSAIRRASDANPASGFKNEAHFKAYTKRLINNAVIDHVRRDEQRRRHEKIAAEIKQQQAVAADEGEHAFEQAKLLEEMMMLDTALREVVNLHRRGVPSRAIAEHCGLAPSTVRNKLANARRVMVDRRTDEES